MTGNASTTSAKTTFAVPMPRKPSPIAITARLGSARRMLARLMARNEPRCTWPSRIPIGTPIRIAIPIASPLISRCSEVLSHIRPGLSQMNLNASRNVSGLKLS